MNFATRSVRNTGIIPKSFKVTVISTALSGAEDNMLHNDNILALLLMKTTKKKKFGALTKVMW